MDQISWARPFAGTADLRALLDAAEGQVRKFGKERRPVWEDDRVFGARREAEWDRVLDAIDAFLVTLQAEHLSRVDGAGASGRPPQRRSD